MVSAVKKESTVFKKQRVFQMLHISAVVDLDWIFTSLLERMIFLLFTYLEVPRTLNRARSMPHSRGKLDCHILKKKAGAVLSVVF